MIRKILHQLSSSWWRGAFAGIILVAIAYCVAAGIFFDSGLPLALNILLALIVSALSLFLFGFVTWILNIFFSWLPRPITLSFGACIGTLLFLKSNVFRFSDSVFYLSSLAIIILTAAFAGTIGYLMKKGFQSLTKSQKVITMSFFVVWAFTITWGIVWLAGKGSVSYPLLSATINEKDLQQIISENPATPGKYKIQKIYYGSGNNKRRPEFGANANLITQPVDGSLLLPDWKDFKKTMREWYWGFGVKEFPLNGIVWYPEGDGPFPLVLVVHGNHGMEEYSDPGYEYLGNLLASKGYILVSVDENFINATWSGDFVGKEMQTRAWLLLQHLTTWKKWNSTKDNQFYNKVDLDNIALIGHSRGGEAIAIAAAFNKLSYYPDNAKLKFDFNFNIKSLIAIAPTDRRYIRRMKLKDINYLTLQGGYDSDEPSFFGMRQADRISNSGSKYFFKAGLYIPGANHGQFNSVWGSKDAGPPGSWFLNVKPMIKEEDQREIAKVYIAGFLEATLRHNTEYIPIFQSWTYGRKWLPASPYLNRFEDNSFINIASYEEDIDLTTGTVSGTLIEGNRLEIWKEAELFYRDGKDKQSNTVAVLGWKSDSTAKPASYAINFSHEYLKTKELDTNDFLVFGLSVGNSKDLKGKEKDKNKSESKQEEIPNFSFVLTDSANHEVSVELLKYVAVAPRWEIQYLKSKDQSSEAYGDLWEPTIGDYQIPLASFAGIDFHTIRKIELRFDKSPKGVIMLDKVGFRKKKY